MHGTASERFNQRLFLTTSQVAELLDVHPSTVKRWSADAEIPVHRTEGGHRRLHLSEALELARRRGVETILDPFAPYEGHVWRVITSADEGDFGPLRRLALGWVHRGRASRIGPLFEALVRRNPSSLPALLDRGIRRFMEDVGEDWRSGRLRVGDEHEVSQMMVETLLGLRPDGPEPVGGNGGTSRRGVVGAAEGDQHHLGSLAIRIVLERAGWEVTYLGPDVPLEEFAGVQKQRSAELVCISFSPPGAEGPMRRAIRVLARLYSDRDDYALALGGLRDETPDFADEPRPFRALGVFRGAEDFRAWLAGPAMTASGKEGP